MALNITVIGTGYLGATHAAAMAELGFNVLGLDVDEKKIRLLSQGTAPMYESGLGALLRKHTSGVLGSTGRLRFTTSYEEAGDFGDVHFLCTGTPQSSGSRACDMRQVESALTSLAPHLKRECLVVGKSTVPVGSAERLAFMLSELAPAGADAELAWNPEFLREGFAVVDTLQPDRIVAGVTSDKSEKILREIYADPIDGGTPFLVCDLPTAELMKTSANSFLAMKISFINAMAEVCEASGADVVKLAEGLGHDPRIGSQFLRAGIGFGGGCLPKDLRAFSARVHELGLQDTVGFLNEADIINSRARRRLLEMVREALGGTFVGRRVAILGATFKPDTDDVRDSPALDIAFRLYSRDAHVTICDPKGIQNAARVLPEAEYTEDATLAVKGADVVLHLTEWHQFSELDPAALGERVHQRWLIDGRNNLDAQMWKEAGWTVRAMGRPRL